MKTILYVPSNLDVTPRTSHGGSLRHNINRAIDPYYAMSTKRIKHSPPKVVSIHKDKYSKKKSGTLLQRSC